MEWINVKDELPKLYQRTKTSSESKDVLIWNDNKCIIAFLYQTPSRTVFIPSEGVYECLESVEYWMPLPESPKKITKE